MNVFSKSYNEYVLSLPRKLEACCFAHNILQYLIASADCAICSVPQNKVILSRFMNA